MMPDSTSLWPVILASLPGLAAIIGVWLNRRRQPAEVRLLNLQADVAEVTKGKTEAERETLAFGLLSKALADADRTIDRLRVEREDERLRADTAERQVKILEKELEREAAFREAHGLKLTD